MTASLERQRSRKGAPKEPPLWDWRGLTWDDLQRLRLAVRYYETAVESNDSDSICDLAQQLHAKYWRHLDEITTEAQSL